MALRAKPHFDKVARENLDTTIQQLLSYTPNPLPQNPDNLACDPALSPIAFYDFHVDDKLSLKRVAPLPSLTANLAKVVDHAMDEIKADGVALPTGGSHVLLRSPTNIKHVDDGKAVSEVYKSSIVDYINPIASMLSLHPHAPWWTSSLKFARCELSHTRYPKNYSMHENAGLSFRVDPNDKSSLPAQAAWNTMEKHRRELLEKAAGLFPQLAVFHFYSEGDAQSERGLRDIDKHLSQHFNPRSHTSAPGCRPAQTGSPVPPDAINTTWGELVASLNSGRRRSSRIPARERNGCKNGTRWIKAILPHANPHFRKDDAQDFSKSMLLHAWARAVEVDATFIVINCANHERIGYRHRESQTLFISEIIDIPKCADPSYTKIHLGLYLSVIEDTLDRTRHIIDKESLLVRQPCQLEVEAVTQEESFRKSKRKRGDEDVSTSAPRKRPRTRATSVREYVRRLDARKIVDEIYDEMEGRRLALLRVQYLHYNSLVPSSFWKDDRPDSRPKKTDQVCSPKDYFVVSLTSALCDGSTGHAHRATLELLGRDGKPRTYSNIVVKLATEPKAITRLQNEYKVYQHLKVFDVKGIPRIFGIYSDLEVKATILVMDDIGQALWQRPLLKSGALQVSPEERESFINVLKSIHAAGVRHRDVRITNMAVQDDGSVGIFDFDMADIAASEASREREMAHLIDLLDGRELPWEPQRTLGTPDNSRPYDANDAFEYVEVEGVKFEETVLVRTQLCR
ncbi:hypothetical protein C0993_008418 [Termitomyces sp. T159_Od127]|nr:hypothetical protein C0993_008418 [Termitomyces sp. T159_Od127]